MNILVTGGAGFIGSHVASLALEKGNNVIILDNLSSGKLSNLPPKAIFYKDDIRTCKWSNYLNNIDAVVHCAAFVSAPESFEYFNLCYETNVIATWRLINACIRYKIKKFIFCSSSAIYPESIKPNYEEECPSPANPYGLTKLDVEHLLAIAHNESGLNYTALRYFNVYGPRQDINSEYSAVIPIFITRALQNLDLIIYGTGKQRRDFIFVDDVANAVNIFSTNNINGIFNIGSGRDYSLIELTEIIKSLTGSNSKVKFKKSRPGDIMFSTASLKKQSKIGQWRPKTDFYEGMKITIDFYRHKYSIPF